MGAHKYPAAVREVAATLKYRYHDFGHYNLKDPLDELLFIICSTKTEEASYRNTFRALKKSFPTHHKIAEAPAKYIASTIASGGLSNQKAKAIRNLLDAAIARFGKPSLEPLRAMSDKDAEAFLLSLPGVGKKIARCVLMYSLDRQAFPVDTHCWRIARRLGWVRPTQKRPALRTARHGSFAIKNPPGTALLATREHDFAGPRDLHRERAEMRKMPDSSLVPQNWGLT
ncbi:MAG: hypothetical protein HZC43_00640 [Nitrosomonadales bacterium]|nr:hypothetical protein [Nitrosomonadales bacterium]